jgi:succinyl-CoA synthetase beta subunit
MEEILQRACERGQEALSEYESKRVVEAAGVVVSKENLSKSKKGALKYADNVGFPVVLKGCSDRITHKTEEDIVRLDLKDRNEVARAYDEITSKGLALDGVIVQEMVKGEREFVIGFTRDPQFGPCIMFGLGGVFTEIFNDVSFRLAPITDIDAEEMLDEIKSRRLLDEFRGNPRVDRKALIQALVGIGDLGVKYRQIEEIDINPLIICENRPVAVDALVVLGNSA